MKTQNVPFTAGGATVNAQVIGPPAVANGGVVVIAYGSDGMNQPWAPMILDYAEQLAALKFSVVIPDYLARTATTPGLGVFSQIAAHRDEWQDTLEESVRMAKGLSGLDGSRVGLLGFSLGGHLCLRARHTARLVVEFFAPEFPEAGGIGTASPAPSKSQVHHGTLDSLAPFVNAKNVQARLTAEGTSTEFCPHEGAGHGFIGADASNTAARKTARERTLAFFAGNL